MGNINQLKQKSTYGKVLLRTKAKGLRYININRGCGRYKDFY